MNKWVTRIAGVLMILAFMFVFLQMYKQLKLLVTMRQGNPPATTSTSR